MVETEISLMQNFIPKKVIENNKEIGEALQFSDGTMVIHLFNDHGNVHVLTLVPMKTIEMREIAEKKPKEQMKKGNKWNNALDDMATMAVAKKYAVPIHPDVLDALLRKLNESKHPMGRKEIISIIKDVLSKSNKPESRYSGYLCYLLDGHIIFRISARKGKNTEYDFHPFWHGGKRITKNKKTKTSGLGDKGK